jgi:septal ring factor EnvC (AmiA/AmiB activator)
MGSTALAYRNEDECDEVSVSSNQVLEANVIAIRADLNEMKVDFRADIDELKGDLNELRADFRAAIARIDNEIRTAVSELKADIRVMAADAERNLEKFAARVDKQFLEMRQDLRDMRAEDKALRERVDSLDKKVTDIGSNLTALPWVLGGLATLITLAVTVGKALHWF